MKKIEFILLMAFFSAVAFFPFVFGTAPGSEAEYATAQAICARYSFEECEQQRDLMVSDKSFNCVYSEASGRCVSDLEPSYSSSGEELLFLWSFLFLVLFVGMFFGVFKAKAKRLKYFFIGKIVLYFFSLFVLFNPQHILTNVIISFREFFGGLVEPVGIIIWFVGFFSIFFQPVVSLIGYFWVTKPDENLKKIIVMLLFFESILVISILSIMLSVGIG